MTILVSEGFYAQAKIFDAIADIRKRSQVFGQEGWEVLPAENNKLLWIPDGMAYVLLVLGERTAYLCSIAGRYNKNFESSSKRVAPILTKICHTNDADQIKMLDKEAELFLVAPCFE